MFISLLAGMSLFFVYCMLVELVDRHLGYGGGKHLLARIAITTLIAILIAEIFGNFGLLGFFICAVIDIVLLVRKRRMSKGEK